MVNSEQRRPDVRRRPSGRTSAVRERTLAATVDLVAQYGIAGVRYEEIAERAGVHRASVYRNWPVLDELINEALIHFAQQEVPIEDSGDLRNDLVQLLTRLAAALSAPTGRAILNALQAAGDGSAVRKTVHAYVDQRVSLLKQRIERAVDQGELPPVDAYFVAELLSGPVHLYVSRGIRPFGREEAEKLTDVVLAGIRATTP